jgi:hypothetical protein
MEKKYWDPFVKQVHMCCVERKEGEGVYCWKLRDSIILLAWGIGHRLLYVLRCLEILVGAPATQRAGTGYQSPKSFGHRNFTTLWRA